MIRRAAPIVLLALTLHAGPATARVAGAPPGPPPMGPPPRPLEMVLESIALSDAQETGIAALLRARRETGESAHAAADEAHRLLAAQVESDTFDEAAIRERAASLAAVEADRFVADAALLRDVRALLTADQREQLDRQLSRR